MFAFLLGSLASLLREVRATLQYECIGTLNYQDFFFLRQERNSWFVNGPNLRSLITANLAISDDSDNPATNWLPHVPLLHQLFKIAGAEITDSAVKLLAHFNFC